MNSSFCDVKFAIDAKKDMQTGFNKHNITKKQENDALTVCVYTYLIQYGARDGDRRRLEVARLVPIVGRIENHLALAHSVLCTSTRGWLD